MRYKESVAKTLAFVHSVGPPFLAVPSVIALSKEFKCKEKIVLSSFHFLSLLKNGNLHLARSQIERISGLSRRACDKAIQGLEEKFINWQLIGEKRFYKLGELKEKFDKKNIAEEIDRNKFIAKGALKRGFQKIPLEWWMSRKLTASDKLVIYALLRMAVYYEGTLYPTIQQIANTVGLTKSAVHRSLDRIRHLEIVDWVFRKGKSKLYYFLNSSLLNRMPMKEVVAYLGLIDTYDYTFFRDPIEYTRVTGEINFTCGLESANQDDEETIEDMQRVVAEIINGKKKEIKKIKEQRQKKKKVREERSEEQKYTTRRIVRVFNKCYIKLFETEPPDWTVKELSKAKNLIKRIEEDTACDLVKYVFDKWSILKRKWRIYGNVPTIGIIATFGISLLPDIQKKETEKKEEKKGKSDAEDYLNNL